MTVHLKFNSLDEAYICILEKILKNGKPVCPRGQPTLEIVPFAFSLLNPRRRYISIPERRWSLVYALGELSWHLRGSRSLKEIAWYAKKWKDSSPDGMHIFGSSYGASIFRKKGSGRSQWEQLIDLLRVDPDSRRAVLYLHTTPEHEDMTGLDVGCALTIQFLVREGQAEAVCNMRSNDAMLGLPYDVFFFTMLQELLATELKLGLGTYHHYIGSLHLYGHDVESAHRIVSSRPVYVEEMPRMEALYDIDAFLAGEARSRGAYSHTSFDRPASTYWNDLLTVLEEGNAARKTKHLSDKMPIARNPLYSSLLALR